MTRPLNSKLAGLALAVLGQLSQVLLCSLCLQDDSAMTRTMLPRGKEKRPRGAVHSIPLTSLQGLDHVRKALALDSPSS